MKKRLLASLAMTAATAAAAVTLSAPAQADTSPGPGWVYKTTVPRDGCVSGGYYYVNVTHEWSDYQCRFVDSGNPQQGIPEHDALWGYPASR